LTEQTAIIIGAGPAGLTAAIELQRRSGIKPIVIEAGLQAGGISRHCPLQGQPHGHWRSPLLSKSDRVMRWWLEMMPVEVNASEDGQLRYQDQQRDIPAAYPGA